MKDRKAPIVVSIESERKPEDLWSAITEHGQMVHWYFEQLPDFKPEVGFLTHFLVENEGRRFTHRWEITKVVPLQSIAYSWKFDEYPGSGLVEFSIDSTDTGCRLTLTNTGLDSFPADIPEFTRESCKGGWEYFIGQRLKAYLEAENP